jgi:hypothetical protein
MTPELKKEFRHAVWLCLAILAAQVISGAVLTRWPRTLTRGRDGLYAVFLTNNQVYFGTLAKESDAVLTLKGIYYIQSKGADASNPASDVSLLKLGNELHGPEDWMEINRDQILFVEKLKEDGKVAKAIRSYSTKP